MLWKVQMNLRVKIAVYAVLSLGVLYVIIHFISSQFHLLSLCHLILSTANTFLHQALTSLLSASSTGFVKLYYLNNYGKHGDFLWDSTDLTIWTTVEACVGIMAASIPTLKPLFRTILQSSTLSSSNRGRSYNQSGYMHHNTGIDGRSKSHNNTTRGTGTENEELENSLTHLKGMRIKANG